MKKLLIISSPSGGGKSTVTKHILSKFPEFEFSISATTRAQRENEIDGKNYFFITKEEFLFKIADNQFIEYERIFDNYYGTLKSHINGILENNKFVIFDIDVKGALSIKKIYDKEALLLFLLPPSFDVLQERLKLRGTESSEQIKNRLARYRDEIEKINEFDIRIINDVLENTLLEVENVINENFNIKNSNIIIPKP